MGALIATIAELREATAKRRREGAVLALVPTMGALHEGHAALIRHARADADLVVVSIFVNPLQFNDEADLAAYPRDLVGDLEVAAASGADLVFAPTVAELHPEPVLVGVRVGRLSEPMEGASRPGHFDGVATVVTKLLVAALPDRAYFGEKDFQQLLVVRRLVEELHLPVEVVAVPTVRDEAGLALSSRNRRLSAPGLAEARRVARVLARHAERARPGDDPDEVTRALRAELGAVEVDYVAVADPPMLTIPPRLTAASRLFLAWRTEGVRLIDNRPIGEPHA